MSDIAIKSHLRVFVMVFLPAGLWTRLMRTPWFALSGDVHHGNAWFALVHAI